VRGQLLARHHGGRRSRRAGGPTRCRRAAPRRARLGVAPGRGRPHAPLSSRGDRGRGGRQAGSARGRARPAPCPPLPVPHPAEPAPPRLSRPRAHASRPAAATNGAAQKQMYYLHPRARGRAGPHHPLVSVGACLGAPGPGTAGGAEPGARRLGCRASAGGMRWGLHWRRRGRTGEGVGVAPSAVGGAPAAMGGRHRQRAGGRTGSGQGKSADKRPQRAIVVGRGSRGGASSGGRPRGRRLGAAPRRRRPAAGGRHGGWRRGGVRAVPPAGAALVRRGVGRAGMGPQSKTNPPGGASIKSVASGGGACVGGAGLRGGRGVPKPVVRGAELPGAAGLQVWLGQACSTGPGRGRRGPGQIAVR
jgi:hypothetical protein